MNFFKKNIILILIFILAIFLRLNYDIFVNGYNFDELAMVSIAKQNFPLEIIKSIASLDYHAPLYYFIIHPFTFLENEWIYLRLLNVCISLINIYVFYKIGTLLKNKKTGYILALLLATSHIQITTVSLVKFYCLCFLLISINLYYLIKILKKDVGYKKYAISSFFYILSATFGFVFVFFEYLLLFISNKSKKKLVKPFLITFSAFIFYLPILIKQTKMAFNNILSPHGTYIDISLASFYNLINDFISPLVNYSCNTQTLPSYSLYLNIILSIKEGNIDIFSLLILIIFSVIPITVGLFIIINAVKKSKKILYLSIIAILFILYFIILIKLKITGFIPIYMYPSGLIIILSLGYGISQINNKLLKYLALSYFVLINLIISNYYPIEKREIDYIKHYQGFNEFIKNNKNNTKPIIVINGARFIEKYYKNNKIISLDYEQLQGKNTRKLIKLFFSENITKNANKFNISKLIQEPIKNEIYNKEFEKYFINNISNNDEIILAYFANQYPLKLQKDEYLSFLNLKYNSNLATTNSNEILNKNKNYIDSDTIGKIILSWELNHIAELLDKNYKIKKIEQYALNPQKIYSQTYSENNPKYNTSYYLENVIYSWFFITYKKTN